MKRNQSNPTKLQASKLLKRKSDEFYNFGFAHITGKHICLKCNTVQSHGFNCCSVPSYYLGKIARMPKHSASRSKWKSFWQYIVDFHTKFHEQSKYTSILAKYNILPKPKEVL